MKDSYFSQNRDYLRQLLDENNEIGIIIGESHSLDKLAGALSFYLGLNALQKNVQIISKRDPIVEHSNLVGVDRIKRSFDGVINTLTISVPYVEGEVEKVSYNIENDKLNVNLVSTAKGITFNESAVKFIKKGSSPLLIFAIGIPNPQSISDVTTVDASMKVINIDNNPSNQLYGDIVLSDPSFSSISEIIAKVFEYMNIPVDIDSAQNLMDGLINATNNFTASNTSAYAFETAGFLLKNGARRKAQMQQVQQRGDDRRQQGRQNDNRGFDRRQQQQQSRQQMNQGYQQNPQAMQQPQVQQHQMQPQQGRYDMSAITPASPIPSMSAVAPADTMNRADVPQDWFTPKIFRGAKNSGE